MATLPRAVQQQIEAAEAILAGSSRTVDQPAQTAQEPAAEPAVQVEPTAAQADPAPQPSTPPPADDVWERKYKTLQGLFNTEVPKLQSQNKDLAAKLQDAIARMDKLATQQEAKQETVKPAADPKDVENFGSDLVEMVQRQTQHVLGSVAQRLDGVVASFEARLAQVEQALKGTTQTVAVTAEEMFFNKLGTIVPDWEQINANDAFLAWLNDVDPVYGQTRQAALSSAQQNLDVARVAAVFNAFKGTFAKPTKAAQSLEKQVSPKGAASAPPAQTEKPILKSRDIEQFYKEVALGKYRGREQEASQLEQIINDAIADGRVR